MIKEENKIVIVGGGFAGVNLVKQLLKTTGELHITLVDRNNYNFFSAVAFQVATGFLDVSNISYPYRKLFRKNSNFAFRMGELLEIRPEENKVILSNGELTYGKLVIATGTESNYFGNGNVKNNALPMKTIADAVYLKNTLLERFEQAARTNDIAEQKKLTTIVIAGGGPTGVEIAGMLSELRQNVLTRDYPDLKSLPFEIFLVDGVASVLAPMSKKSQEYTLRSLQSMGVIVRLNVLVKDYDGSLVILADGTGIETYNLIWTAGVTASTFSGITTETYGRGKRLLVDEYNKVKGFGNIYAIGDTCLQTTDAAFPNGHPQLAQVAIQQGQNLAFNINALSKAGSLKPFHYNDKGSMAIIGRYKAVTDVPKPHLHFRGGFA